MKIKLIFYMLLAFIIFNTSSVLSQIMPAQKIIDDIEDEIAWIQEEAYDIEVVTASGKSQKISKAPATIISITKDQIKAYGWRDLKDIFRAIPGVDVSYNVQGEMKTMVIMRGVTGNQKILILQDGHKYSPATGEPALYGNNMPLNIYKKIEIIYGPASCIYGADAYAGVINLITKNGADYNGTELNAGYISTGAYTSDLSFGKQINDNIDVLISARIFRGQDEKLHENYKEYEAVNSYTGNLDKYDNEYPIKNWNFFFKLHYYKFTLGFDWQHELESNAYVSKPQNYAYVDDFVWGQDLRNFYINHNSYSSSDLNINTTIELGDYEVNNSSNFYIISQDEYGNFTDAAPAYKYAYSSYIRGKIQAQWDITDKFSTVWGASYEDVKSFPKTRNLSSPFNDDGDLIVDMSDFTDSNGYTFGIADFSESEFGERNFYNFGMFVNAEYKFNDMFKIDVGMRYDYNEIYKETINPRAGIIIDPVENLTIKLLYGTAYIQPANYFRYENYANAFIMNIPNEDLEPEELENYSLDISYILGKNYLLRAGLFYNKMDNIIRTVEAPAQEDNYPYYNPYREDQGAVRYNGNRGEIKSKGGEISLTHKYDRFFTTLSYSYVTGEDEGFDIAQISKHKVILNSSYIGEKWTTGITLRYYSDVSTDADNALYGDNGDQSYDFDGDLIAYLNVIYQFTKNLSANLNIDNVFDTKHYGGVPFDGSPVVVSQTPQPLRKIYLGLRLSY